MLPNEIVFLIFLIILFQFLWIWQVDKIFFDWLKERKKRRSKKALLIGAGIFLSSVSPAHAQFPPINGGPVPVIDEAVLARLGTVVEQLSNIIEDLTMNSEGTEVPWNQDTMPLIVGIDEQMADKQSLPYPEGDVGDKYEFRFPGYLPFWDDPKVGETWYLSGQFANAWDIWTRFYLDTGWTTVRGLQKSAAGVVDEQKRLDQLAMTIDNNPGRNGILKAQAGILVEIANQLRQLRTVQELTANEQLAFHAHEVQNTASILATQEWFTRVTNFEPSQWTDWGF